VALFLFTFQHNMSPLRVGTHADGVKSFYVATLAVSRR
jgi:hypothetical protein